MLNNTDKKSLEDTFGNKSKILCTSKGQYRYDNPYNLVIFNSNICTKEDGKLWYGDIDLTIEEETVKSLARNLNKTVYVLYEGDARFKNEDNPLFNNAVYSTDGERTFFDNKILVRDGQGRLLIKSQPEPTEEQKRKTKEKNKKMYKQEDFKLVDIDVAGWTEEDKKEDPEEYQFYNCIEPKRFFENINSERSPIHNYQCWLRDTLGVDLEKDFAKYYVTKEIYTEIHKLTKIWFEVFHGSYLTEYQKQKNLNWIMFNNGPSYFLETPDWAFEDKLYRNVKNDN